MQIVLCFWLPWAVTGIFPLQTTLIIFWVNQLEAQVTATTCPVLLMKKKSSEIGSYVWYDLDGAREHSLCCTGACCG